MTRRRGKRLGSDVIVLLVFAGVIGAALIVSAARSGNLLARVVTVLIAIGVLTGLYFMLRALKRLVMNSMVIYTVRKFLDWATERWTHSSLRAPDWFGTVGDGEVVYAIAAVHPDNGFVLWIKLGYSESFEKRLKTYKTLAPYTVVVLAVGPGTYQFEQHILRLTKKDWARGSGTEWRKPTTEVWELVQQLPGANLDVIQDLLDQRPAGVG